jgi:alpha-amylase
MKGEKTQMKIKKRHQIVSAFMSLCIAASCVSFAFTTASAVTKEDADSSSVSAVAGSVVEDDGFTWDNASVYFLLTDRFKNGNTSNDHSYGRATDANGNPLSGWDTAPGTFHGGDFAGITQEIEAGYFDDLGVNALWISAPYEQIHGYVDSGTGFAHYSYHGYYVLDYTETDANFGTKEEFQTLVDTAHEHGIRIVMDVVMNHAGYNTIADMEEYGFGTLKSGALDYKYRLTNVSGMHDYIDYTASSWSKWWGGDWIRSGLPGYTQGGNDDYTSSLSGLPDFKTESTNSVSIPELLKTKWTKEGTYNQKIAKYGTSNTVSGYITTWLSEWVETYGVDGFRCDTAKHVELASWNKLKTACVSALNTWRQNNPDKAGADWQEDFWMTGECWGHGLGESAYYTSGGFDSMINFSFSGSGVPAVGSINSTYSQYASEINTKEGFNALTYISSHDSNLYRGDLIYQGSAFQLMPGAIQIYYGDETNRGFVSGLSFDGNGGSGHSLRSDMNWDSIDQNLLAHWQKVGQFRNKHVAVGAGSHQQITAYNSSTGYTFSRSYDDGDVVDNIIATIGAPANTNISVDVSSVWSDGVTVTNYYDGTTAVVTNGKATFNSGANGTILIEGPTSTIAMSLKGGQYSFYDSQTLTVSLRGADYAMVSVNGGAEFKVTNGQTFSVGEGIGLGETFDVVMTASNADENAKKTYTYKKKDPAAVTKLYFDNTSYKWSAVNAYIYDESSSNVIENAEWPGEAMTYDNATGLYVIEVSDELTNGNVIFTEGYSSTNRYPADKEKGLAISDTSMIFSAGNSWTSYTGQEAEPTTAPDPTNTKTVYYDNSNTNFTTPYIYYWSSSSNSSSLTWPGVAMTKYKDNIWKATFSAEYDMCIFSNNGGNKTGDLTIPASNYLYNGSWSQYTPVEPTTATQPTTVPVSKVLIGDVNLDGTVSISDATEIQKHLVAISELTGDALTAADVDVNENVDIKDVTCIQFYLVGETSKAGKCNTYTDGSQPVSQPVTQPTTTQPTTEAGNFVYYQNTNNWSNPTAYYWSDSNKTMTTWPGKAMTSVGNGVYKIELPADATYIIFSNNGGSQTADLTIPNFGQIYNNGSWSNYSGSQQTTSSSGDTKTIYYKNSSNWSTPTAYYWSSSNTKMTTWPGKAMTSVGNGVYSIEVPSDATYIIFSDNGGSKTGDLTISGNYYTGSWSTYNG